jgi:hypothetical protein
LSFVSIAGELSAERASGLAFEQGYGAEEEAGGCENHENDRVAIGGLCSGWSGGGVVAALGASLRVGEGRDGKDHGDESDSPKA